jgi:hypothetical protein
VEQSEWLRLIESCSKLQVTADCQTRYVVDPTVINVRATFGASPKVYYRALQS